MIKEKIIIIHGCPDDDRDLTYDKHWQPWLKNELEKREYNVKTPLMPNPWAPVYQGYKEKIKDFSIDEDTILIGHSCGTTFWIKYLNETKKKIKKLILVAPWNEPESQKNEFCRKFYDLKNIDYSFKDNIGEIIIFTSDTEEEIGKRTAKLWEKKLDAKVVELKKHGHFVESEMGKIEFPELLNEIKK